MKMPYAIVPVHKIYKKMKTNKKNKSVRILTNEGGKADKTTDYMNLRRSVMSSFLWENSFYEDGVSISERIKVLVPKVQPELVAELALEARTNFKLRHVPLFLARELARNEKSRHVVADTLEAIIQRPDELNEFVSLYWKDGKQPLAASVKKGLARAFTKFNEKSLAKYNQDADIKLRDVLFLCHAKPLNKTQGNIWKRLINNDLKTPDTWEVELSKSTDKKVSWERLLKEEKLGALALLRNLRNFKENNVNEKLIINALENMNVERVLPFRFISAAKYYPSLEEQLEQAMFKSLKNADTLKGKTALAIDVSGSMDNAKISAKSELTRLDAATALAILLREVCKKVDIFTFSKECVEVAPRRGFALRDAIVSSQRHADTLINSTIETINSKEYDRVIILTDGQIQDDIQRVNCNNKFMLNVANEKNGIGYKNNWTNIDGFSESVVQYLIEIDK
jgi:60 kDa SS-A/Ro ribonucleoprotein